jgi:O-antigen ligase
MLQFASLIYTKNQQEGWEHIRLRSGLLLTPLAVYCSVYINNKTAKRLFLDFSIILGIAALYCFVIVFFRYQRSGDFSLFFYHQLVSPLKQHAVYFSIFVFIALVYLLESIREKDFLVNAAVYIGLAVYLSIFLFFLSSKLVIIFFIFFSLYTFIRGFKNRGRQKIISLCLLVFAVLSVSLVLTTQNPVGKRFSELLNGDVTIVGQRQYSPADYLNGLQFRILQWKLVPEILNENKAWFTGVGAGDAQSFIDKKYIEKNLYTGDPVRKDHGFLGYNTHNQFLQALLENGVIGLLVFIFVCFGLIRIVWQRREPGSVFIIFLLIAYSLIESVFETQFGIIIMTFFPLFLYFADTKSDRVQKKGK